MKHVLVFLFTLYSSVMWAHEKHPITSVKDTIPLKERYSDFLNNKNRNPFDLKDPSIIEKQVEYDPKSNQYIISEKIGDDYFRMPTYMTASEYFKWKAKEQDRLMLDRLAGVGKNTKSKAAIVNPFAKIDLGQALVDRLFGGTEVSIIPQGTIDIPLGLTYRNQQNPVTPVAQQRQIVPNFDMNIQVNVTGKVGEKLSLTTSYNNKATFNFDNVLKLNYDVKGATNSLRDLGKETAGNAANSAKGALPGVPDFNNEDEIIRDIDAGNVSLPLKSNLIQGASSLFGIKLGMQFGKLRFTTVAAQQQSRRQQVQVQQGGQKYTFQLNGDQYDENRHFFFTHSFRNNYEPALVNLPQIASLYQITYLEVWVTNDRQETNNVRDIVALTDLAEPNEIINTDQVKPSFAVDKDINGDLLPYNEANNLYSKLIEDESMRNIDRAVRELTSRTGRFQMQQTRDFEKVRARKLSPSDYSFDPKLGYISLNFQLRPNQVLGVAFTYKYNGKEYKVGELAANAPQIGFNNQSLIDPKTGLPFVDDSTSSQKVLFVKMLKSSTPRLDIPLWDLMMKNVYSLGASQINKEDFRLEVYYNKPGDGERRFLPAESKLYGVPLLQLFNLDKLNVQGDPNPDGVFDYVEGITINSRQGKIIFPVLEPFGKSLEKKFKQIGDEKSARKYVFQQLYDTTITAAREFPEFNVFTLKGQYKGTSQNEIQLNTFNLPKGSVRVTAGGQPLQENVDYEVNYSTGTVKILNEAFVNSSVPVNVSFEDNQLFGFQQKSMFGTRWDYTVNKDFVIGGTVMKLFERPFTNKVNFGEDPINNNIFGIDVNYTKESPWVTKMIDKLPLISTKAPSSFSFVAEGAVLKPGHSRAINQQGSRDGKNETGGVVFLEDFEGSTNGTDLRQANLWYLASVPQDDRQGNNPRFPESAEINSLESNKNRAKLSWYIISDNSGAVIQANDPRTPADRQDPRYGEIQESEIWPNRQFANLGQGTVNARLFDLNYIPTERGPYNYDLPREQGSAKFKYSEGLDADGKLIKPASRWGGIMRALPYNDFEASNVEFIDMWIVSPFIGDQSLKGKLHIDLGNVSEDILRDSRQFYENGLPTSTQKVQTDRTKLARIPRIVPVTSSFEVNADRKLQDVGLDGYDDVDERNEFKNSYLDIINKSTVLTPAAKNVINDDPSNDNFKFFLDNSFTANDGISKRYFRFNNPQGNSAESTGNFTNSSTNIPDSEDLDNNKSLDNEGESYFHYEIPLEADGNGGMVANQFVVDAIPLTERKAKWNLSFTPLIYRVRVPISQFTKSVGGIQDFRSIRFMRVYLTDFEREVTLRFAKFELSRSQWRRYKRSASAGEPSVDPGANPISTLTTFDVNSVNFEENGSRPNYSYVLPPGIQREQIPGQAQAVLQNEQAMAMSICNLLPEAERGIYKLTNFDLRLFKQLKMFVHMEPNVNCKGDDPEKGELSAFIRLGNDFERNYYEYEIPIRSSNLEELKKYGIQSDGYRQEIWPADNEFNFPLSLLTDLKERRNAQPKADFSIPFEMVNPDRPDEKVKVVGNPNIGWVKGIMIGVRNRSELEKTHSVEVWVNELRAVGFNERGGAAGLLRADLKLADVGRVTLSGNFTGIGWGGLEQRLQQRSREQVLNYDVATNIELGKLFPEKSGVKIPLTVQYSNKTKTPEFDPYDLDIKLKDKLSKASADVRDSLREQALTKNTVRNISFDNVRIESTNDKKKPMPWNISNFAVSYQNTTDNYSDPIIENQQKKLNKGQIDYNYSLPNTSITPFKKAIKNDKYLKFITDFNFNPLPNNISINTEINRQYSTTRYRFTPDIDSLNTFYNKRFTWDRKYNVSWDITKGMKFNFIADVQSVIDEPQGGINTKEKRDSIWRNVKDLGRTKLYNQQANLNYTLPTKQIPFMDWITVKAQLNTTYNWTAAALNTIELGNTIKNSQQRQLNGDFNFEQLYNHSKYLKKINTPKSSGDKKNKKKAGESSRGGDAANALKNKKDLLNNRNDNKLDNIKSREKQKLAREESDSPREERQGREKTTRAEEEIIRQDANAKSDDAKNPTKREEAELGNEDKKEGEKDSKKLSKEELAAKKLEREKLREEKKKQERENREPSMAERTLIRPFMMVRKGRFTYTETYQNILPGFKPQAGLFGQQNFTAPGWNIVVGDVPTDKWLDDAAQKGWITKSVMLNESVTRNYQQQLQGNLTVEPFTDFRIEFDVNKNYTKNNTHDFKVFEPNGSTFEHKVYRDVGSFTVSYMNFTGIFSENNKKTGEPLFDEFLENRKIISYRLAQQSVGAGQKPADHEKDLGYYTGFGRTQQEVLIPAFMAAYTGKDANTIALDARKTMPLPNWRINYSGLTKLPFFKERVQSFTLQHSYKSTFTLNQFNTNTPDYDPTQALTKKDPVTRSYYSALNIPTVVLNKEFSPLIGFDLKLKNDLSLKADFKKGQNLQMSFFDNQLMEQRKSEYTVGVGYKMKNVHLKFLDFLNFEQPKSKTKDGEERKKKKNSIIKLGNNEEEKPEIDPKTGKPIKKKKKKGNDFNINCNVSVLDQVTYNRAMDANSKIPTRGDLAIRISPSADYIINKRLTLRFEGEYQSNRPKTTLSFPTTTISGGIRLRFALQ